MKWLIASIVFLITLLAATNSLAKTAKTLTIAVIDTGIDSNNPKLCKFGHKSFLPNSPNALVDTNGHGTHIAGLIAKHAGDNNYCLVAIKYYGDVNTGRQNLANMRSALRYAINIKADYINISGGGPEFDEQEFLLIREALKKKITIVVAAGNERSDLDASCNYFPACYDKRIVMVGNLQKGADFSNLDNDTKWAAIKIGLAFKLGTFETEKCPSSNYGLRVTKWEIGTDVVSTLPGGKTGTMTGTSQATAIETGKMVRERFPK